MDTLKIIIAGSRTFKDYEFLKKKCDDLIEDRDNILIISGGAQGADLLGEKYAREKGFRIKRFMAKWERYGNRAGFMRNEEMAIFGDVVIIFNVDKSKGSTHMKKCAMRHGLVIKEYNFRT